MKKAIGGVFVFCATVFASFSAHANSYWFDFMSNDSTYEAKGVFNTSNALNAVGTYNILSISGNVFGAGGGAITGLVSNPNQPYSVTNYGFIWDNTLPLNNAGVVFTVGAGSMWNLFADEYRGFHLYSYNAERNVGNVDKMGTFVTAPVPEPETYAMMMVGLGLLGFMARRKKSA